MPPAPKTFDEQTIRAANGCLIWMGRRDPDGYGKFRVRGRELRAHRVAWSRHHDRPVPDGLLVLHTCDTPPCVEPSHLYAGTHAENTADMDTRGRRRGQRRAGAPPTWRKLTDAQIQAIRVARDRGATQQSLAEEYGVTATTIRNIEKRRA